MIILVKFVGSDMVNDLSLYMLYIQTFVILSESNQSSCGDGQPHWWLLVMEFKIEKVGIS